MQYTAIPREDHLVGITLRLTHVAEHRDSTAYISYGGIVHTPLGHPYPLDNSSSVNAVLRTARTITYRVSLQAHTHQEAKEELVQWATRNFSPSPQPSSTPP